MTNRSTLRAAAMAGSTLLALSLFAMNHEAQAAGRFEGSAGFMLGFPSGDYGKQVDGPGGGFDIDAGWRPPSSPAVLGARFGYLIMGSEKRREPLSNTVPIPVDVVTDNNQVFGHLTLRLEPPRGAVRPFIEGVFGFSHLFTDTKVKNSQTGEEFAGVTQFKDTVLSFGGGGGLKIKVWGAPQREQGKVQRVFVNTRVDYLHGGEGEYLKKGSLVIENGRYAARRTRSLTDIVTFSLGVSIDV